MKSAALAALAMPEGATRRMAWKAAQTAMPLRPWARCLALLEPAHFPPDAELPLRRWDSTNQEAERDQ